MYIIISTQAEPDSFDFYHTIDTNIISTMYVLEKQIKYWKRRARVKKKEPKYDGFYDLNKNDFTEILLPFADHPHYQSKSDEIKKKILACAWVAYNEKTVSLETEIVNPICIEILSGKVPGLCNDVCKQIVSEVMVDESYHVLMMVNSTKITKENRKLDFKLGKLNFVNEMKMEQSKHPEYWKKIIIQFITTISAEIFTSVSMATLSKDSSIQSINQQTVYAHLMDEICHGNIFTHIAKIFYASLSLKEKNFFNQNFCIPSKWLADFELSNWKIMLASIGFGDSSELIGDCQQLYRNRCYNMDYGMLVSLGEKIGIVRSDVEKYIE